MQCLNAQLRIPLTDWGIIMPFNWQQSANAHCPMSSSPSGSSTLLNCKHLENKNESIFLTAGQTWTFITSFWSDCEEYIKIVSKWCQPQRHFGVLVNVNHVLWNSLRCFYRGKCSWKADEGQLWWSVFNMHCQRNNIIIINLINVTSTHGLNVCTHPTVW